ncbi:hypothetical protein CBOM_07619 [Ceraceosorus bombacis]|uniref:Uncharacterized protein n=1 Tax=Ceraceosorus bombacis TaxID=401625 RepID=A0A0P1BL01_9BASI|nr:hypothetical protein CBOM_07619 [Ceraceosorus bombacis]
MIGEKIAPPSQRSPLNVHNHAKLIYELKRGRAGCCCATRTGPPVLSCLPPSAISLYTSSSSSRRTHVTRPAIHHIRTRTDQSNPDFKLVRPIASQHVERNVCSKH